MTYHPSNPLSTTTHAKQHDGMILIIVLVVILMLSLGAYTLSLIHI